MTRGTVLVIDDERLVRWSLSERLSQHDYEVIEAATGRQALEAAAQFNGRPVVILLDLRLPDVDGMTLLQSLHAEHPKCPVIVISAHATPEVSEWARELGARHVTSKPFDLDEVEELIEKSLASA
jgi:two-component system nitrogen regulation response regulator GlnG